MWKYLILQWELWCFWDSSSKESFVQDNSDGIIKKILINWNIFWSVTLISSKVRDSVDQFSCSYISFKKNLVIITTGKSVVQNFSKEPFVRAGKSILKKSHATENLIDLYAIITGTLTLHVELKYRSLCLGSNRSLYLHILIAILAWNMVVSRRA